MHYIDANVFDHIEKGDRIPPEHRVPPEHCAAFRAARLSGHVSAYLSLTDVEELLGDWDRPARRPAAIRCLRHARDLVGFDYILKPPDILMAEEIRAYAEGRPVPSPFLSEGDEQRRRIINMLESVADGKDEYTELVLEIVAGVRAMKAESKAWMEEATRQGARGLPRCRPTSARSPGRNSERMLTTGRWPSPLTTASTKRAANAVLTACWGSGLSG
jgi:hypothetical protein